MAPENRTIALAETRGSAACCSGAGRSYGDELLLTSPWAIV
jgi:hypothetical protein